MAWLEHTLFHKTLGKCNIYARTVINHGFEWINIRRVPRKVFEHEAAGRVFKHLPRVPANVSPFKAMGWSLYSILICKMTIIFSPYQHGIAFNFQYPAYVFRSNEWEKHDTRAWSLPATGNETLYLKELGTQMKSMISSSSYRDGIFIKKERMKFAGFKKLFIFFFFFFFYYYYFWHSPDHEFNG